MTATRPTYDPTNIGNPPGQGPLRAGGQSIPAIPQTEQDRPSKPSKAAERQAPALNLVRDLWAGNRRLHDKGPVYLPQSPGEEAPNYAVRLARAVFVNVFRKTIEGLCGYMYRADPDLGEDVPPAILAHWENIDNAGLHGDVFVRERTIDAGCAGHSVILVEYPQTGGTQSAAADGGIGGSPVAPIRPYWVPLQKENILSWRTAVEDGRTVLTQLVVKECGWVPDGLFGEREQKRYRVFYRERTDADVIVGFRLLEEMTDRTVVEVDAGTYPTQDEIPVAEIRTSGSRALFDSDPPFEDLGWLNLAHYRQWSDYDTSIHKTCCPIYTETGIDPPPQEGATRLVLGPNTARRFTRPDARTYYTEHGGAALGSVKQSLDDIKTDMAMLGLAALQSSKRTAETATAKELDKSASDSVLAVWARGVQDGVERALYFHARYLGLEDGGSIIVNRDYGDAGIDAPKMQAWVQLATDLGVPIRMLLERFQLGGEIPEDANLDAIESEMMANAAAIEARKAEEQAARMEALAGQGGTAASPQAANQDAPV
jgi:hypothetical protein